ncbi:MAG: ATP-binding protein, partial [Myxococcales bacterium]
MGVPPATTQIAGVPVWIRAEIDAAEVRATALLPRSALFGCVAAVFAALLLILLVVGRGITRPLRAAVLRAEAIAGGDFDARVPVEGPTETRVLAGALNHMAEELRGLYAGLEEKVAERGAALTLALDRERALLARARDQAEELRAQNEELQSQAAELRAYQQELYAQQAELEIKNFELEKASRLKSQFLASMSHELRTPLNAVIGFSELLSEQVAGPLNREQLEFVGDIHRSGRHLLALINDVLDLAKIESGHMKLSLESFDLREPVREALEIVRPLADARQHRLALALEGAVFCNADRQRVRQIALNLLSNAVKFTPEGGTLTVACRRSADGAAELVVRDTGIGIDPAHHAQIFDEFRQVDGELSRAYEGTGLGLALVKRFCEQMQGSVAVDSRRGEGAQFTVRLPEGGPAPASRRARPPHSGGLSVLVAEDDHASRALLEELLAPRGHRVRVAGDGRAAVAALDEALPDVLVLDLMLPHVDGFEVLRGLRARRSGAGVRVVVLTAMDLLPGDAALLEKLGAEVVAKGSVGSLQFVKLIEGA